MAEGQDACAALPSLHQFMLTEGLRIYTQKQGIWVLNLQK